ncbi:hypothetical protein [Candidiatus Paracoxiella cheracis]|uniref:hypothetical protein n=1 Tax=Candidiatus Paracoxiella cheracis TaxID=3405120 RepID=UPI003BF50DCB
MYNNIGREGARYIAEALKSGSSPSGLSIDLSNNNFGLGGAQYIAEALESGGIPSGLTINLDNNYIPEIGIKAIYESLSILIKRNNTLLPKLNGSLEVFNLFKEDILKVILGGVSQDYWLDIESLFDQIDLSFNCFNFYTQEVPDELFKIVQGFLENTIKAKCMAASIDTDSTEIHDIQKLLKFWHNRIPDLDPKGRASCLIEVSALMPELSNKLALIQQACRDARDRLLPSLSIIDSQYATT